MSRRPLRGLYAITDARLCAARGLEADVAAALRGGAAMIQYRDKGGDAARRRREAAALLALCRAAGARLIINDDVELAAAVGADGVHLGQQDPDPAAARARLGDAALVGVSCHASLALARRAAAAGASYVAFGAFHPSPTKPGAVPAPLELLREARDNLRIPIAAIGGITAGNGAVLIAAGADLLAVVSGIFGSGDPEAAARAICRLFTAGNGQEIEK